MEGTEARPVGPELLVGSHIGQYRVQRKLGEGGMGVVYEAVHQKLGKRAAVKVLHGKLSSDPRALQRFFNEAKAVSTVGHPGLVQIFDYGQEAGGPAYILMEFMEGESLADRLIGLHKGGGRLATAQALQIVAQLATTLAVTHDHGIVHRDLKPDNVFLVPDPLAPSGERAKILDFGIAKFSDLSGHKTTVGLILGTPRYMAPEQCEGREDLDGRVDVYALGVLLFEILSGEAPFVAETAASLMRQHMFKAPPLLSERVPALDPALYELSVAMLAKEPAARPTMAEVAARLERPGAALRRRSKRSVLVIAAALLLLGAAAGILLRRAPVSQPAPASPPVALPAPPAAAPEAPRGDAAPRPEPPQVPRAQPPVQKAQTSRRRLKPSAEGPRPAAQPSGSAPATKSEQEEAFR